jgi:hypothetical protein
MTTKRKPAIRDHQCEKEDQFKYLIETTDKLGKIITGNGTPENGLMRQVAIIKDRQDNVIKSLGKIDANLMEFHTFMYSSLNKEKTLDGIKAETRTKRMTFIKTASFIVGAIGLVLTAYGVMKNSNKIGKSEKTIIERIHQEGGISKATRGGSIIYNDKGIRDSINVHDILIIKQLKSYIDDIEKTKKK